jgi:hypothetical protein
MRPLPGSLAAGPKSSAGGGQTPPRRSSSRCWWSERREKRGTVRPAASPPAPDLALLDTMSTMCQRDAVVARALQILTMVLLAALVAQTACLSTMLASGGACAEQCDDGCPEETKCPGEASERGGCPPDCQFCACCGLSMRALPPVAVSLLEASSTQQRIFFDSVGLPASPEPRGILHVPKLILA